MMRPIAWAIVLFAAALAIATTSGAQQIAAPVPQPATIVGTVQDVNGGVVPDAKVVLDAAGAGDPETVVAGDNGFFQFVNLKAGMAWRMTISAPGFAEWNSKAVTLMPGQYFIVTGIDLRPATIVVSVVALTPEQVATRQVKAEETQRAFGVVPNFYVVDDHNPEPLTPKLNFQLALKALNDPVSLMGYLANAGIYQAADYPGYRGGMAGYGQRLGATLAGAYTHVLVADAVLPSLLHQDDRYFYQGTGTTRSRMMHAFSNAIFTAGDNGRREINYSGIGGDLASGAIANAYYPSQERGVHLLLTSALIGTGGRIGYALANEFVLNRHTSRQGAQ